MKREEERDEKERFLATAEIAEKDDGGERNS